jgi:hypothetical protein
MKYEEYVRLVCESFWLHRFFDVLPAEFTPRRELRIQNFKLQRLLDKQPATAKKVLGAASLKKLNKQIGEHNHKTYQQAKLVRTMMVKAWEEAYREDCERRDVQFTKKVFKAWFATFDAEISDRVKTLKKKILETERQGGMSAMARLSKVAKLLK